MLLQLSAVSKTYGTRPILKNISLELFSGTITLLTGTNGSGKSTLLKIMAGLSKPTTGKVTLKYSIENLGYLGHDICIYPELSALENLMFWGSLYNQSINKTYILTILERVELIRFAYERAGIFSRGMAQRLNLARVLMLKPKLLLLDEPGTGLDTQSLSILYDEIMQAKKYGASIVWISHNITHDIHKADHLIILKNKKLAYNASTKDYILTQPNEIHTYF